VGSEGGGEHGGGYEATHCKTTSLGLSHVDPVEGGKKGSGSEPYHDFVEDIQISYGIQK
jgi:hypothetical protein